MTRKPLTLALLSAAGPAPKLSIGEAATLRPASHGIGGRLELMHHWERMTHRQRRELVEVARELVAGRTPGG